MKPTIEYCSGQIAFHKPKSADEAVKMLKDGEDLLTVNINGRPFQTYCSIRDMKEGCVVELRYNNKIDVTMVTI